ncbi:MAG: DinB family protein [Deltaproteobacteria bacterium]|nr:DinB family protein [Deltaproteobacteria bacterium]
MQSYFLTLARYNQWANLKLYQAVSQLTEEEIQQQRPSFFGSIFSTLNHGLVGDTAWSARIQGKPSGITALDQPLAQSFKELQSLRQTMDKGLISLVESLSGRDFTAPVRYQSFQGDPLETPLQYCLGHMFNHTTHHRGQVHDQLSWTVVAPPSMDLIYYLREQ